MEARATDEPRAAGIILRDGAGTFYAIAAERLTAFRVADCQRPLVEAIVRGEDAVGFGGIADDEDSLVGLCRPLRDPSGAWVRSFHVTQVASSLWVLGH